LKRIPKGKRGKGERETEKGKGVSSGFTRRGKREGMIVKFSAAGSGAEEGRQLRRRLKPSRSAWLKKERIYTEEHGGCWSGTEQKQ